MKRLSRLFSRTNFFGFLFGAGISMLICSSTNAMADDHIYAPKVEKQEVLIRYGCIEQLRGCFAEVVVNGETFHHKLPPRFEQEVFKKVLKQNAVEL